MLAHCWRMHVSRIVEEQRMKGYKGRDQGGRSVSDRRTREEEEVFTLQNPHPLKVMTVSRIRASDMKNVFCACETSVRTLWISNVNDVVTGVGSPVATYGLDVGTSVRTKGRMRESVSAQELKGREVKKRREMG